MDDTTKAALDAFVARQQEVINKHYKETFPSLSPGHLSYEEGNRYARLVLTSGSSRSSYGFVDMTTGNIYKAASWKQPAKGIRGSIFLGSVFWTLQRSLI